MTSAPDRLPKDQDVGDIQAKRVLPLALVYYFCHDPASSQRCYRWSIDVQRYFETFDRRAVLVRQHNDHCYSSFTVLWSADECLVQEEYVSERGCVIVLAPRLRLPACHFGLGRRFNGVKLFRLAEDRAVRRRHDLIAKRLSGMGCTRCRTSGLSRRRHDHCNGPAHSDY